MAPSIMPDGRFKLGGADHPDVADSLIEVGVVREFQGNAVGAQPLLQRALEIRKKKSPRGTQD